jgi:hypothetical protein
MLFKLFRNRVVWGGIYSISLLLYLKFVRFLCSCKFIGSDVILLLEHHKRVNDSGSFDGSSVRLL